MSRAFDVVFMGTPDFAVPSLKALCKSRHRVRLVVTQPDRPKGRGRKVIAPPVKIAADQMGCPVVQPVSVKTDEFVQRLEKIAPDLLVVAAYGHILKPRILDIPKRGPINVHASLLPKYRGAAPIQWAIINGENKTGVTIMQMAAGMDTGDILMMGEETIFPDDTAATLHDRLAAMGADLLLQTLDAVSEDRLTPTPQDDSQASYAPMLKKSDGHIPWQRSASRLDAFIRGMNPWPGAFTFHGDTRLKIYKASPASLDRDVPPGTVVEGFADELRVAAGRGALSIQEIQIASGKRMGIRDFLLGYALPPGTLLT
jgi:methionyl-tRNA formyltransferase